MNQERSGKKGQESLPADLVKNKEALNRLARSGDAQRLMELLRQGGGALQALLSVWHGVCIYVNVMEFRL